MTHPNRRTIGALAAFAGLGLGCGGHEPTAPQIGPPSSVTITTAPATSGVVGQSAGTMSVRVADANGATVSGATVNFTVSGTASVSPTTVVTDGSGAAATTVTIGSLVGEITITASVGGSSASATATVLALPGPVNQILVTPETAKLWVVGDTIRVTALATDQYSNLAPGGSLTFISTDPSLLSVDGTGLVRALRQDGVARIVASAGAHADTSVITVVPAGVTPCTGVATATPMSVGQVATFSGVSSACLGGEGAGAEFALVAFNSTIAGNSSLSATVSGTGLGAAPSKSVSASAFPVAARAPVMRGASASLTPDNSFHVRLQQRAAQALRSRIPAARAWYRASHRGATSTKLGTFNVAPSYSAIPSAVTVGEVVRVNVNANRECTSPNYHGAKVVAVGTKSIVLADTLNPTGGFTDADYARFAARFDTLVY
ncbi:MAG: Ig-like domain-containing protein, partial [Gemmatimonadaceae bacterium]